MFMSQKQQKWIGGAHDMPALSFGLEIETVFAFHQQLLQEQLDLKPGDAFIYKETRQHEHKFRHANYVTRNYNSWAIARDGANTQTIEPFVLLKHSFQGSSAIEIKTHFKFRKQQEYSGWTFSSDPSLAGLSREALSENLKARRQYITASNWDSSGLEIISPPFDASELDAAFVETGKIVKSLHTTSYSTPTVTHDLFISDITALHVHVGKPDGSPFALSTIQQLVWLLICYEPAITSLQTSSKRSPLSAFPGEDLSRAEALSLRDSFIAEEPYIVDRAGFGAMMARSRRETAVPPISKETECMYEPLANIHQKIFNPRAPPSDTETTPEGIMRYQLTSIINLFTKTRGYVVNLRGLIDAERPNTIEFRQHHGTIDMAEIKLWTKFCIALVTLAQKLATDNWHCYVTNRSREWEWLDLEPPEGNMGTLTHLLNRMLMFNILEEEDAASLLGLQARLNAKYGEVDSFVFREPLPDLPPLEDLELGAYQPEEVYAAQKREGRDQ
ncbi:MAG: hypothetical protein M1828_001523 [Chrysothrix sp. TS-e1954]|nr:MAG: hypothetical protein M1828_001523 [Chrysothrix sp. TS-e1954]